MAALCCTAVMVAVIAVAHASADGTKRTTVDGPAFALNETSVTTSKASGLAEQIKGSDSLVGFTARDHACSDQTLVNSASVVVNQVTPCI